MKHDFHPIASRCPHTLKRALCAPTVAALSGCLYCVSLSEDNKALLIASVLAANMSYSSYSLSQVKQMVKLKHGWFSVAEDIVWQ